MQTLDAISVLGRVPSDPKASQQVRARLLEAASAIAGLVPGFASYAHGDFDEARAWFDRASELATSRKISAIVHLMLGNIANRLNHDEEAASNYSIALDHVPEFVRAELGFAQLTYKAATGRCARPEIDTVGLDAAQAQYDQILRRPALSQLTRARVLFGLAQIHVCRSQAELNDEWEEAKTAARAAIAFYHDDGNLLLRVLASEAYALVALADSPVECETTSKAELTQAIEGFQRAADLALEEERRAVILSFRTHLESRPEGGGAACPRTDGG